MCRPVDCMYTTRTCWFQGLFVAPEGILTRRPKVHLIVMKSDVTWLLIEYIFASFQAVFAWQCMKPQRLGISSMKIFLKVNFLAPSVSKIRSAQKTCVGGCDGGGGGGASGPMVGREWLARRSFSVTLDQRPWDLGDRYTPAKPNHFPVLANPAVALFGYPHTIFRC